MSQGKSLLETWFQRVWTEQDPDAVHDMFAGGQVRGLGENTAFSSEDFIAFQSAFCNLVTDIHISIDKCLDDGTWISALCTLRATSRRDGQAVVMTGCTWCRYESGVIQEAYNHFDFMGLFAQLGLLPQDSFEQGLAGQTISHRQ